MGQEDRKKSLLSLNELEENYKALFVSNPDVYFYNKKGQLYKNWDDFRNVYLKNARKIQSIPGKAPSIFEHVLQETDFFPAKDQDVDINLNARYCPPFWHHLNFIKIMYVLNGRNENSMILFCSPPDEFLERLIQDLIEERQEPKYGGNFLMISYVSAFVAYALSRHKDYMTPITGTQTREDKFPEIIQYSRENYSTVTLPELAEHFNRSESYLSRYIKRQTGYSLVRLLKEYRMKQAGILLHSTRFSVEDIMMEVGYTDISYFYKVFREYYGMTPKHYREQKKELL